MKKQPINLIKTFQNVYNTIKKNYHNNPSNLLDIILGFGMMIIATQIFQKIEMSVFTNNEHLSIQERMLISLSSMQYLIFSISSSLFLMGTTIGCYKLIFNKIDGKETKILDIFSYFNLLPKFFIGFLLENFVLLMSLVPVILFIYTKYGFETFYLTLEQSQVINYNQLTETVLPSLDLILILVLLLFPVFCLVKLCFLKLYIIDQDCSPSQALKKSWIITKNHEINIVIYCILFMLFNFLGVLTYIGFYLTIPLTYLFVSQYYRILNDK